MNTTTTTLAPEQTAPRQTAADLPVQSVPGATADEMNALPGLDVPRTDKRGDAGHDMRGMRMAFYIPRPMNARLRKFCADTGYTLSDVARQAFDNLMASRGY